MGQNLFRSNSAVARYHLESHATAFGGILHICNCIKPCTNKCSIHLRSGQARRLNQSSKRANSHSRSARNACCCVGVNLWSTFGSLGSSKTNASCALRPATSVRWRRSCGAARGATSSRHSCSRKTLNKRDFSWRFAAALGSRTVNPVGIKLAVLPPVAAMGDAGWQTTRCRAGGNKRTMPVNCLAWQSLCRAHRSEKVTDGANDGAATVEIGGRIE
jgi:hypothetical protein